MRRKFKFIDRRILWGAGLIILILLMMDFNNRLGDMLRLKDERDQTSLQLTHMVMTQEFLETRIAYATSDVSVQEWARQEGRMVLPGDVPIVPVAPQGAVQPTANVVVPTVQPVANWQVWEALFFGK